MAVGVPSRDQRRTFLDFLKESGYELTGVLGRGENTGFLIHHAKRGSSKLAVKGCYESSQEGTLVACLVKEHEVLNSISHPNIVRAHHFIRGSAGSFSGACILMDLCPGSPLQRMLSWSYPGFTLSARREVMRCTLSALSYLHRRGILHRDVHSKNVMAEIGVKTSVKLIDFNSAVRSMDPRDGLQDDFNAAILPIGASEPCDVYAFGLLAAGLIGGHECTTWSVFKYSRLDPGADLDIGELSHLKIQLPKPGRHYDLTVEAERYLCSLLTAENESRMSVHEALDKLPEESSWSVENRMHRISL